MLNKSLALAAAAAMCICTAVLHADTSTAVDRFSFVVANAPQDALAKDRRMYVTIHRWSTDEERQRVVKGLSEPATLLNNFFDVGAVGYMQWPGGLEYTVRYARRTPRPEGGWDVVMVAERPVWLWWDASAKWDGSQQFSVVHLRVGKDGKGEGRVATGSGFKADKDAGITLADTSRPPLLTDVRRESIG
jgi:hypothetical protein